MPYSYRRKLGTFSKKKTRLLEFNHLDENGYVVPNTCNSISKIEQRSEEILLFGRKGVGSSPTSVHHYVRSGVMEAR